MWRSERSPKTKPGEAPQLHPAHTMPLDSRESAKKVRQQAEKGLRDFALSGLQTRKHSRQFQSMKLPAPSSITDTVLTDIERRCAELSTPVSAVLEDAGVDWSTWWRWKQSKSSPTLGTLSRVAKALDKREKSTARKAA